MVLLLRSQSNRIARRAAFTAATLLAMVGQVPAAWARSQIFVADYSGDAIAVFPRDASGDVAPSYTILGEPGDAPHGTAINHAAHELIVANNLAYSVAVYDLVSGVLKRTIAGPSTGIIRPTGVAVDELHGELYVANDLGNSITVYDILASGDAAPKRTILSASLSQPVGVAVDLVHDEIVVANYGPGGNSITTFDRLASGDSSPKRVIQGDQTNLNLPQGVALDLIHDEIVVANSAFLFPDPGSILAFARTADGDVAPIRTLEGDVTGLCHPIGLALDVAAEELVVANSCAQSVTIYDLAANGNTSPTRTVAGATTTLSEPISVAVTSDSTLKVKKRATRHRVNAGDEVGFTIFATARGGPVFDVVLSDELPGGFDWSVDGADASSCTLSAMPDSELTCLFGDLARGESREVRVSAISPAESCSGITNRAMVAYNDGTAEVAGLSPPARITIRCKPPRVHFPARGAGARR